MKTIKQIKKRKSLIRFIAMFVAAVLVFELMPYLSDHAELTAEAAQTLSEFEQSRWNSILGATFNEYTVTGNGNPTSPSTVSSYTVKDNSPYFQWHDTESDIPAWTGSTSVVTSQTETVTYEGDTVKNGSDGNTITANAVTVTYNTYHVENADEFVWVMTKKASSGNTRIILDKDIDMGGALGRKWSETIALADSGNSWFDLEGNGHTIYNFRMTKPLINSSASSKKTIISSVLFSNCLAFFTSYYQGIVIGIIKSAVHLENVSVVDSLVDANQQNIGILIGRVDGYTGGNIFLENCSTLRSYIYGTSHIGGMTACIR